MDLTTSVEVQLSAILDDVDQRLGPLMMRHHPFFRRADAGDPRFLRTMLQLGFEFSEVLGRNLTWLAHRLWDTNKPVASILISQLHDELGHGRYADDGHPNLYRDMVEALEPWADAGALEAMRGPQDRLVAELARNLGSDDLDRSLGTYVGTELIASDVTVHIGQVMNQLALAGGALRWSRNHDVVEIEHLAGIHQVPRHLSADPERRRRFWDAASDMMLAMWRYFDALDRLSFAGARS